MSLMRAPASRTSSMRSSWRGRSRMTTVMSRTRRPSASAIRPQVLGGRSRGCRPCPPTTGPTHSFSRYVSGAWIRPPVSDAARTVIAPAWPWATRFVPSSGSTAMSTSGRRASAAAPADLLADVEHRRLVALALADDDPPGDVDLVHRPAHRLGRQPVGAVPVAAAHEARRRDRRRLGDAHHLEGEQLFHRGLRGLESVRRVSGRKCRRPVKTIARWCRSATSMAISSRIEPPGWMIAVTPAPAATWIPSGNGK